MVTVRVPATSANIGSGFDTLGVALKLYNTVSMEFADNGILIEIMDPSSQFLPRDENNLVYRAAMAVFEKVGVKVNGLHIVLNNCIPITRGLGSSSSGIVGGLVCANNLCGCKLSMDELVSLACKIEGHPDNTTPALLGGFTVSVKSDKVRYLKLNDKCKTIKMCAFIPSFTLNTKVSRSVLPKSIAHSDAVFNTSRVAMLVASITSGNLINMRTSLQDRLHQPYRKPLIHGINNIFNISRENKAIGTYLSGAGPTVISVVEDKHIVAFKHNVNDYLKKNMPNWHLEILEIDRAGTVVI